MPVSVTLPDGTPIDNVPDGITQHELALKLKGAHGTSQWVGQHAVPAEAPVPHPSYKLGPTASFFARPAALAATGTIGLAGPDEVAWLSNLLGGEGAPKMETPSHYMERLIDAYTTAPTDKKEKIAEVFNTIIMGGVGGLKRTFKVAPEIRELAEKGVVTTPGQRWSASTSAFKKMLGKLEEGASRNPAIGPFIAHARGTSVEQAARAQVDDALRIAGERPAAAGGTVREALIDVGTRLSARYDRLFAGMRGNKYTKAWQQPNSDSFENVISNVWSDAQQRLSGDPERKVVQNIIARISKSFDAQGNILGQDIKTLQRDLRQMEHKYETAPETYVQEIAPYVERLREGFSAMLARGNNPDEIKELATLDKAWAQYAMTRRASVKSRALGESQSGAFTPQNLLGEARSRINKLGPAGEELWIRQQALGQRLGETSRRVLGDRLPDSGTPYGLMASEMLSGTGLVSGVGALSGARGGTEAALAAGTLAATGAVPFAYSQPVLKLLQNLSLRDRELLSKLGIVGGTYGSMTKPTPPSPLLTDPTAPPQDLSTFVPPFAQ